MTYRKNMKGFTLLELMIVIVVVGILAAIGYPSYADSIRKSKRGDAQAALLGAAQQLEVYYARNAAYNADLTEMGYGSSGWNDIKDSSGKITYRFRVNGGNGNCPITSCYVLVAQTQNAQTDDSIQRYRLWSTGRKQAKLDSGWTNGWTL